MPKVHFIHEGKTLEMKPLTRLWEAVKTGIVFVKDANCGGNGTCRQCRCKINGVEKLSCMEKVYGEDLEVETMIAYK